MGVRIMQGDGEGDSQGAVLYCSTSGWAFGPIFDDREDAQAFLDWLGSADPRVMSDFDLERKHGHWLAEREAWLEEREKAQNEEDE